MVAWGRGEDGGGGRVVALRRKNEREKGGVQK